MTTKRSRSSRQERSNPPVAPAAAYPPWVVLDQNGVEEVQGCTSSSIADAKTMAFASSTTGVPISVSLCLASPPEGSRVCVQHPAGVGVNYSYVVAAHGDCMLVQVAGIQLFQYCMTDHFVYNIGDVAAILVPAHALRSKEERGGEHMGWVWLPEKCDGPHAPKAAELLLLRSAAAGEWIMKRPPMSHYNGDGGELPAASWTNHTVIPFRDRLCWVDLRHGLMFADVFNENPALRYVPLPDVHVDPCITEPSERNVCVTDGGGTIKFVDICPRYRCKGAGHAYCQSSHHAYTVRTWTLRMHDMAWVKDGSIDSTELWSLDSYKGIIPRVELDYPVVCIDDPHIICVLVCEGNHKQRGDCTMWRIMVDMRSKTLRSTFCYPKDRPVSIYHQQVIPSRASGYLNSKPSSGSKMGPSQAQTVLGDIGSERHAQIMLPTSNITNHGHPECESSSNTPMKASSLEKILASLTKIPGLDHDDMLKAYRCLQTTFGSPN
ncbi:unnamed protein product [Urochloa decumbens]|uniref:DUF1618 domain-containing protein n=1 Tax=Urochloa decumbens TaxID=240449 RepID=A0ABC9B6Q5_9POAL